MELDNTEKLIAEKILDEVSKNPNLTKPDIKKLIEGEIARAKYLREDWQIHYAIQRIFQNIDNEVENIIQINKKTNATGNELRQLATKQISKMKQEIMCPNCGATSTIYIKVWVAILILLFFAILLPLYLVATPLNRCAKCKKLFDDRRQLSYYKTLAIIFGIIGISLIKYIIGWFLCLSAIYSLVIWLSAKKITDEIKLKRVKRIITVIFCIIYWAIILLVGLLSGVKQIFNFQSIYNNSGLTEKTSQLPNNNAITQSTWEDLTAKDEDFKILFPAYPKKEIKTQQIPNTNINIEIISYSISHFAEDKGMYYFLALKKYPTQVDTSIPQDNLKATLNTMVLSTDGSELVSEDYFNFQNNKALNFEIQNSKQNFLIKGKLIMVDKILYQIFVVTDRDNFDTNAFNKFTNSFKLIK